MSKQTFGFYVKRGAPHSNVGGYSRFCLPTICSDSTDKPIFKAAVIGAVRGLLRLESPSRYPPTTRDLARCSEVDHRTGR